MYSFEELLNMSNPEIRHVVETYKRILEAYQRAVPPKRKVQESRVSRTNGINISLTRASVTTSVRW
jgi:hypothetical protein